MTFRGKLEKCMNSCCSLDFEFKIFFLLITIMKVTILLIWTSYDFWFIYDSNPFLSHLISQVIHCLSAAISTIGIIWSKHLLIKIFLEIFVIMVSTSIITYFCLMGFNIFYINIRCLFILQNFGKSVEVRPYCSISCCQTLNFCIIKAMLFLSRAISHTNKKN